VFDKDNTYLPFASVCKGDTLNLQITATAKFSAIKKAAVDDVGDGASSEEGEDEKENQMRCGWNFRVWQMKVVERAAGASTPPDEMTCDL